MHRDSGLDTLLLLDGERFVIDGGFWVKFEVKQVPASPEKPHGLDYSLTMHDSRGWRLVGFDNAHSVREGSGPGARTRIEYDHQHNGKRVRFYEYSSALDLLTDFWNEVDLVLKERSAEP